MIVDGAEDEPAVVPRRRVRARAPRRRQVVVRFSDVELAAVRERAALVGLAVGAWVGQTAFDAARHGSAPVGLVDLVRLHADVVALERAAVSTGVDRREVLGLLTRLDAAVDVVVGELSRRRR